LDVTVVVLAGPNIASLSLDDLCDHIVDKSVLIPQLLGLEVLLVDVVVECLENILEPSVVFLENGVLGGHVKRIVAVQGVFEASMGKCLN